MQILINISEENYKKLIESNRDDLYIKSIKNGTILPRGYGKLIDANELEQRIERYIKHHECMYQSEEVKIPSPNVIDHEKFILEGIKDSIPIIEEDKEI